MRRWALLLALWGCGDKQEAPAGEPKAPAASHAAAAAQAPAAAAPGSTLEERRARYEARLTVALPEQLPGAWKRMVSATGGRVTAAEHEARVRVDGAPAWRHVRLELRLFGTDAEVDARLLSALKALNLPGQGDALPEEPVEAGDVRWSVERQRFVAPPGEARETIATIAWTRSPPQPAELSKCRKPQSLDLPADTPSWLRRLVEDRSTRRRVGIAVAAGPDGAGQRITMLFHNGFAQDESVGQLIAAAKAQGFTLADGSGTRQRWRSGNQTLAWRPINADLALGCNLEGPVVEIAWSAAAEQ